MKQKKVTSAGIGMTSLRTRKRLIEQLREMSVANEAVLDVILSVPRHAFLEEALASHAYDNAALPIGHGQTISQPSTVARMTNKLLEKFPDGLENVLEIGTGCGYQSAIIAAFAQQVISIERIKQLHYAARDRLYDLKIRNVKCLYADGFLGCADYAPYEGILAAAVSDDVPEVLIEQLAIGGRLLMPVLNDSQQEQHLIMVDKTSTGIKQKQLSVVAFVPRQSGTT